MNSQVLRALHIFTQGRYITEDINGHVEMLRNVSRSADVLTVEKPNKSRKIPEVPTQNRYFGHVISHVRGK